jgi:hypothetical protein
VPIVQGWIKTDYLAADSAVLRILSAPAGLFFRQGGEVPRLRRGFLRLLWAWQRSGAARTRPAEVAFQTRKIEKPP